MGALNPRQRIVRALTEPLITLGVHPNEGVEARLQRALEQVGLAIDLLERYPHQLSGGQRQRVCLARAADVGALRADL